MANNIELEGMVYEASDSLARFAAAGKQASEQRSLSAELQEDDLVFDRSLRPKCLNDYLGQTKVKDALSKAVQQVTGKPYRVKVMEESNVGTLSTKANPVDDIIRRAGELDITLEIND